MLQLTGSQGLRSQYLIKLILFILLFFLISYQRKEGNIFSLCFLSLANFYLLYQKDCFGWFVGFFSGCFFFNSVNTSHGNNLYKNLLVQSFFNQLIRINLWVKYCFMNFALLSYTLFQLVWLYFLSIMLQR